MHCKWWSKKKLTRTTKWRGDKQYIWKRIPVTLVEMIQDLGNRKVIHSEDIRKVEQRPRETKEQANRDEQDNNPNEKYTRGNQ